MPPSPVSQQAERLSPHKASWMPVQPPGSLGSNQVTVIISASQVWKPEVRDSPAHHAPTSAAAFPNWPWSHPGCPEAPAGGRSGADDPTPQLEIPGHLSQSARAVLVAATTTNYVSTATFHFFSQKVMKLGTLSLHGNREGARAVQIGDSQAIRDCAAESARSPFSSLQFPSYSLLASSGLAAGAGNGPPYWYCSFLCSSFHPATKSLL